MWSHKPVTFSTWHMKHQFCSYYSCLWDDVMKSHSCHWNAIFYHVEVQKNKCVIVTSLRVLHKHSECWTWSGIQVIFFKWMLLFSAETLESFCHRNLWREIALGLPHYIMTCREQRRRKWSSPVTQNQILTQNTKLPLRCNFMHTCMVVLCTCKYASMI